MRIALIDSTPKAKFYPLALLKIGAWRKSLGDDCKLFDNRLPKAGEFNEIWITTTFTYDIPHALGIVREAKKRADRVLVGGISATLRRYIGDNWTFQKRNAIPTIRIYHSFHGEISMHGGPAFDPPTPIKEFEYWFGKDPKEFIELISYPQLRRFCKRKAGILRWARAKGLKVKLEKIKVKQISLKI